MRYILMGLLASLFHAQAFEPLDSLTGDRLAQIVDRSEGEPTRLATMANDRGWSAETTNTIVGIAYRFSVARVVEAQPRGTNFPVVLQIRNMGKQDVRLLAHGGQARGLSCNFYADGKRVGSHPTVGLFVPAPLVIAPQETLRVDLGAVWWWGNFLRDHGSVDLVVAFHVWNEETPRSAGRPEDEMRTAPVRIIVNPERDNQPPPSGETKPGRVEARASEP